MKSFKDKALSALQASYMYTNLVGLWLNKTKKAQHKFGRA
jgi:hypothetical protein